MPVQMNKYKDPRDGSICVMPNSAEKVETKHGVFVRVSNDADNKTAPTIVPVAAAAADAAVKAGVNVVADPSQPKIVAPPTGVKVK